MPEQQREAVGAKPSRVPILAPAGQVAMSYGAVIVTGVPTDQDYSRNPDEIAAALTAAADWLPHSDNPQYVRGAVAAFGWLLGRIATAPISGQNIAPTLTSIRSEENLADDAVYGSAGGEPVDRHFAVGAQTALLWARGLEKQPPISLPG